jgi:beta-lactamase class A
MVGRRRTHWVAACGSIAIALILSSCGGSTSGSAVAGVPSSTSDLTARTLPNSPAGTQLRWLLSSVANAPLSQGEIASHFDASFLGEISAAQINAVLAKLPAARGSLVGLLAEAPSSLIAIASFGTQRENVSLSVDGSGLIDGLRLGPTASVSSWSEIDTTMAALAPNVSFLAARVSKGSCQPIHQLAASTPRPLASEFKLFVLGALANQVATGQVRWSQELTVENQLRSSGNPVGSGSLQFSPAGTKVSVLEAATKMISISDNTAADMLINLVGRPAVEAQVQHWSSHSGLDVPFLSTREMVLLHYVDYPMLANAYLNRAPSEREAFLGSSVDPLSLNQVQGSTQPRDIDKIEWFGSPDDVCRAFVGLQRLSHQSKLSPMASIFSVNKGGIGLDPTEWPAVWFKGGSEPGVLTLAFMATNNRGRTFVVSAMLSNATAALAPSATVTLLEAVIGAFGLMG